ncbi:hypothetical protein [Alicycliphilus denitrificans]|uniref:hypothetical protein n=1 Tax=Alicycliphilus denitrificans TaxID=179636 RepID=UPI000C9FEB18|nr:hypothetical protein [Alicycliphilus denitrificans]
MSQTVVVTAPGGTAIVNAGGGSVVTSVPSTVVVEHEATPETIVVTRGIPGPRGQQGIPGPAGGAAFVRQTDAPLSALCVVWEDAAGVVRPVDYDDMDHVYLISGLTLTATPSAGDVTVQRSGPVDDTAWTWTPGPVYLGAGGALTQAPPADGFDILIGYAVSPARLYLDIQDPISLED